MPDTGNTADKDFATGLASSRATKITVTRPSSTSARRWGVAGRVLGVAWCLMSLGAGTVFGHFYWGSPTFRRLINEHGISAAVNTALHRDPLYDWIPEKQFPNQSSINILVLGVDHDYNNKAQIIKTTPGRSDSILIARVDFINKTISALTIPRDTAVHIPGHNGIRKINAAHSLGGPDLLIETIKSVFGIDTDAYVALNFEGFQKIVDAIGGININVEKRLKYDDNWGNLHVDLHPGYQHLDGYRAMGYVRMRHSDSDMMRSKRQHNFLEAVRTKLKEPGTFMSLPNVVERLNDNLKRGRLTEDQMFALANFARTLPKENINVETLPSEEGPSYVTIDSAKSGETIRRLFFPNELMARSVDAPDPGAVQSMNSRYGGKAKRTKAPQAPPPITGELSVEPPPDGQDPQGTETRPPDGSEPPPPTGAGTEGAGTDPEKQKATGGTG